jgi:hypothetical protein
LVNPLPQHRSSAREPIVEQPAQVIAVQAPPRTPLAYTRKELRKISAVRPFAPLLVVVGMDVRRQVMRLRLELPLLRLSCL